MGLGMIVLFCVGFIAMPSVAYQFPLRGLFQESTNGLDGIDIASGSEFNGLTTFAHLPYVPCLSDSSQIESYDIAFLGAPFDTVGF